MRKDPILHLTKKDTIRGEKHFATLLIFLPQDCVHEIKPVLEGYRVALSHNLYYEGNKIPKLSEDDTFKDIALPQKLK
jgi:hypothetical protein